jgi:hypothetical protein
MPDPQVWEGLKGMGAWWAGKGPSYEVAKTNRLEQEQEQEQLRKREKVISALTVYDVLKGEGPRGAAAFLQDRINRGAQEGQDVSQMEDMYREILSMKTPDDLKSALQDGARLQREAQMRGWMDAPEERDPAKFSAMTRILPGGFVYQADNYGRTTLRGPDGNEITDPEVRAQKIQEAMQIEQQQARAVAEAKAGGQATGSGIGERQNDTIARGVEAARSMPILKRSLNLLSEVETGGVDGAIMRFKNATGIESANEAELTANLARNVLSQLRDTFGAQFTEREGKRLERIEAGIGKSTQGNKRILTQLVRMNQMKIAAAMKAAEQAGDAGAIEELERWTNFSLTDDAEAFGAATQEAPSVDSLLQKYGVQ